VTAVLKLEPDLEGPCKLRLGGIHGAEERRSRILAKPGYGEAEFLLAGQYAVISLDQRVSGLGVEIGEILSCGEPVA